jgi:hypothetical protein
MRLFASTDLAGLFRRLHGDYKNLWDTLYIHQTAMNSTIASIRIKESPSQIMVEFIFDVAGQ